MKHLTNKLIITISFLLIFLAAYQFLQLNSTQASLLSYQSGPLALNSMLAAAFPSSFIGPVLATPAPVPPSPPPAPQPSLISALRSLLASGLPADIRAKLTGPKGDQGSQGIQGIPGMQGIQGIQGPMGPPGPGGSGGATSPSIPGSSSGSFGSFTNLSGDIVNGRILNVSEMSTLNLASADQLTARVLNVTGSLTVNGSPITSGGTGSQWTSGPGFIYFNGGNVGIGTTNPAATLSFGTSPTIDSATSRLEQINGTTIGTWATLTDSSNLFNITGAFPDIAGPKRAVYFNILTAPGTTGGGRDALNVTLDDGGYTGSNGLNAGQFLNSGKTSGTVVAVNAFSDGGAGITPGQSIGVKAGAKDSVIRAIGSYNYATGISSVVPLNIGSFSIAQSGTVNVGAYAALMSDTDTFPTFSSSAAFIADNGAVAADIFRARDNGADVFNIIDGGNVGIGTTTPTAVLHLKAGTATASTAPLKFTSGTLLGATEAGAVEYDGTHLYFTAVNAGTRFQLDQQSAGANTALSNLASVAINTDLVGAVIGGLGIRGGTAADDDLILEGTTNATRTNSYVILQPNGGSVGIGTTTPTQKLHIFGTNATSGLQIERVQNNNSGPFFTIVHARAGLTALLNGDNIGQIDFQGHDGTNYQIAARIMAQVDGTPGTNDMPGRLVFFTTPDGSAVPTERMRIDNAGNVGIGTTAPTSKLQVVGLPVFANNAAAVAGGLTVGAFYRTGADPDPVMVVH